MNKLKKYSDVVAFCLVIVLLTFWSCLFAKTKSVLVLCLLLFTPILLLIVPLCIDNYIDNYCSKHPEKFYGGDVYKAKLISITPKIKVFSDLSKESNILNSETKVVEEILVQETSNKYYVREIITGKLIPVSYDKEYCGNKSHKYSNYEHCVFVRCKELYYSNDDFWKYIECHLEEVSPDDLQKYIDERKGKYGNGDFDSFADYLDHIFAKGERYYQDSELKSEISDSKKREIILKNLNTQ